MIGAGTTIQDRYRLDRQIGQGGFARVYLGFDLLLRRPIAVKVLKPALSEEPLLHAEFRAEAQRVAALDHTNILQIYDYGEADDSPYLVMPYISSGTLYDRLRAGELPALEEVSHYLRQIAAALDYAHRQSIVHRDLKPQNLLLRDGSHLLLADFGISRLIDTSRTVVYSRSIGTLTYMAPEQFDGEVGYCTDIYALGCVLFELLAGKAPYSGTERQIMFRHSYGPIPSVTESSPRPVPVALQSVIERALAKDPKDRFLTAGELAQAFADASIGGQRRQRRKSTGAETKPGSNTTVKKSKNVDQQQAQPSMTEVVAQQQVSKPVTPTVAQQKLLQPITEGTVGRVHVLRTLKEHGDYLRAVAFSGNGTLLASGCGGQIMSSDNTVRLWRVSDDELLHVLVGHEHTVSTVAFSPDDRLLASASHDRTVRLWRVADGKHVRTLTGHTDFVRKVAFSPDGQLLASCGDDKAVRLWRASDGELVRTLTGHVKWVRSLAFSPDGQILASCGDDESVRLWRVSDGKFVQELRSHGAQVNGVAFSPDGQLLASCGDDKAVRLWRASDGELVRTLTGHNDHVRSVVYSPDCQLLATGSGGLFASADNSIRFWRVADGDCLRVLSGHTDTVSSVTFSPDGQLLASGSHDKTVRLWGIA